jgi:putative transposase
MTLLPELAPRFRAECLNAHRFLSLADAREKMEDCRKYYNEERQH